MVSESPKDTMLRLEADAMLWFISLGAAITIAMMVINGSIVHSGPCKVTVFEARDVWRYHVVDEAAGSSVDVIRRQECGKCNTWPLLCCSSNETFKQTSHEATTATLFLKAELTDCFDKQCTRLGAAHAYTGSWPWHQQRMIRAVLRPNATLTCYWNKWDGYQPFPLKKDMTFTILPWFLITSILLMTYVEASRRYQEAKMEVDGHGGGLYFTVYAAPTPERITPSQSHVD